MKVFECFAGIGAPRYALSKLGMKHETIGISELEPSAEIAYRSLHQDEQVINYGDIFKIDPNMLPDFDLLVGGFPCQPFSTSGFERGAEDERGLLVTPMLNIAKVKKPRFIVFENVKAFTFKKHKELYNYVIESLKNIGYNIEVIIDDSLNYGSIQNRNRVYIVGDLQEKIDKTYLKKKKLKSYSVIDTLGIPNGKNETSLVKKKMEEQFPDLSFENAIEGLPIAERSPLKYKKIKMGGYSENNKLHLLDKPVSTITCSNMQNTTHRFWLPETKEVKTLGYKQGFIAQGFDEEDFDKLDKLNNKEKGKVIGNTMEIKFISAVFKMLFKIK